MSCQHLDYLSFKILNISEIMDLCNTTGDFVTEHHIQVIISKFSPGHAVLVNNHLYNPFNFNMTC